MPKPKQERRWIHDNGLTLVVLGLFASSFAGQAGAGFLHFNSEQALHGQPAVSLARYLMGGDFLESVFENLESEFLQMGLFVILTTFLYQRGSAESKNTHGPDPVDEDPRRARDRAGAPWPVRRGGWVLWLYERSLSLLLLGLFAASFILHARFGAQAYNDELRDHAAAAAPYTTWSYLASSRFWFESFQNWQSEFLSIGVLVVASIFLRQRGSAQSKPVAASYDADED